MKNYIILLISLLFIVACEDEVDITLAEVEDQIVFDAWVNNMDELQIIKISQTQNYFNADPVRGVENATVRLARNDGQVFEFLDQGNGEYHYNPNGTILGNVGDTMLLQATINGAEYRSISVFNPAPQIDSIVTTVREDEIGYFDGINAEMFARDLVGRGNTYWIKTYRNGIYLNKVEEMNIAFDAAFDGGADIDGFVFIRPIRELVNPFLDTDEADNDVSPWEEDDMIRVEIHGITNEAFAFLERTRDELFNGQSGIFAAPIANTTSNVFAEEGDQEVLGFFSVSTVSMIEERIGDL